jgi:hypothetical protein
MLPLVVALLNANMIFSQTVTTSWNFKKLSMLVIPHLWYKFGGLFLVTFFHVLISRYRFFFCPICICFLEQFKMYCLCFAISLFCTHTLPLVFWFCRYSRSKCFRRKQHFFLSFSLGLAVCALLYNNYCSTL